MRWKKYNEGGFMQRRRENPGQFAGGLAEASESRERRLGERAADFSEKSSSNIERANRLAEAINREGVFGRRGAGVDTFGDVIRNRRYNRLVGTDAERAQSDSGVAGRAGRQAERAEGLQRRADRWGGFADFMRKRQREAQWRQAKSDAKRAEYLANKEARQARRNA